MTIEMILVPRWIIDMIMQALTSAYWREDEVHITGEKCGNAIDLLKLILWDQNNKATLLTDDEMNKVLHESNAKIKDGAKSSGVNHYFRIIESAVLAKNGLSVEKKV